MSADIAIETVTLILTLTCIVGNCFVCAVLMRNRDMRIPINYLLVNLAVADIFYSTFSIPVAIFRHNLISHPEGMTGRVLCSLLTGLTLGWVGVYASFFTLNAIAIERYFAVVYPYGNKGKLTMRKLKVIIAASWIIGLILQYRAFLFKDFVKKRNRCVVYEKRAKPFVASLYYAYIFLSCILLVVLYSRVVYTLWFKSDGNTLNHQQQGVLRVRKRVTLMVATVSAIFVISYGTDAILHLLNDHTGVKLSRYAIRLAHTVLMFNSAVNPYAYALINQRFRQKIKKMICCASNCFETRVALAREQQYIEMADNNGTQSNNIAGTTRSE